MTRMTIDCRTMPSESGCTLTISGEPEEVLRAAAAHAVDVHGHREDAELRDGLRSALTPSTGGELEPGAFLQVIEFRTDRIDEFEDLVGRWAAEIGSDRTARWAITGADRNEPGRYVQVVAFPDYDAAMANSKHPVTARFAEVLSQLATDPRFVNLDVRKVRIF